MYEHTERQLRISTQWLEDATDDTLSAETRISAAFVAGYIALQSVQPAYTGQAGDHPLVSIICEGAALLALRESDLKLGLALRAWEDHGRYMLEPAPAAVEEVLAWALRVYMSALRSRRL